MIDLLKTDLPTHYGLHRCKTIEVPAESTSEPNFDLTDNADGIIMAFREGNVSFAWANQTETEVINYERYLNNLSGTAFERGKKRCDCIIYEKGKEASHFFILNEQTSTIGTTQLLSKPILDKKKNVQYPGGKYEKVETQLLETLQTLIAVPSIAAFIDKYNRKICLMSYVINPRIALSNAQKAFTTRYKKVEARETGENGALLECPVINLLGFEYRRISHNYVFRID